MKPTQPAPHGHRESKRKSIYDNFMEEVNEISTAMYLGSDELKGKTKKEKERICKILDDENERNEKRYQNLIKGLDIIADLNEDKINNIWKI